jgi:hypothetical protein
MNADLADAMGNPDHGLRVPDNPSPVLAAEQIALALDRGDHLERRSDARERYLRSHNFDFYAARLLSLMGVETGVPPAC